MSPQATAPQHPAGRPRVAIVTGGSRGIGHEAVKRLAADGNAVVVGYAGHRESAEAAAQDIAAAGGRAVAVRADVAGPTATDLFLEGKDEETIARMAAQPPRERLGTPADIAEVVASPASPAGHWVNGQVIRANGGIV
ncbi:SDR family NAD(P)-dependent oxidoreductase [Streptomyces antimycoticus]|uniref:SDR family NAD(P)-dependent oxidoreductase n=1 Tax=Streptomyces antimycoticus TaxID=68175 RepID=UPI0036C6E921